MALIRPSLTLVLDIDSRLASEATILELKRCYMYISAPLVRTHEPASQDAPLHNTARIIVNMGTRKYLRSEDEGADQLWNDVVEPWIGNMLHKIGSNMKQFNYRQRSIKLPEIVFDCFDIELQGGAYVVSLHPNLLGFLGNELQAAVGLSRALLNDGTFAGATRVRIPADASFDAQAAEALPLWQAEHPEVAEEAAEEEAAEETPWEDPISKYSDPEWLAADAASKSYENTAVPITDSEELPSVPRDEEPEPPEPFSFEVDYTLWDVQYADGTNRLYNSALFEFVQE